MGHMGKEPEDARVSGHFLYRKLVAFFTCTVSQLTCVVGRPV
jgi:hypothetical protein